jgi:hypothetical protein
LGYQNWRSEEEAGWVEDFEIEEKSGVHIVSRRGLKRPEKT